MTPEQPQGEDESIQKARQIYEERRQRSQRVIQEFKDEIVKIPAHRTGEKVIGSYAFRPQDESFTIRWENGLKVKTLSFLKKFGDRAAERFLEKHEMLYTNLRDFDSDDFFSKYYSLSAKLNPLTAYIAFGNRYREIVEHGIDTEHYYRNVLRASEEGGKIFAKWYGYFAVQTLRGGCNLDEFLEESLRVHKAGGIKISNSFLYNADKLLEDGHSLHDYAEESLKLIEKFGPDIARWMVRSYPLKNYMDKEDYDFNSFIKDTSILYEKNKKAAFWFNYGMNMILNATRASTTPLVQEYRNNFARILENHGLSSAILYSVSTGNIKEGDYDEVESFKNLPKIMDELKEKTSKKVFKSASWLASMFNKKFRRAIGKSLEHWNAIIEEHRIKKNESLILDRINYTIKVVKLGEYYGGEKTILGNLAQDLASDYIEIKGEEPSEEEPVWRERRLPVINLPKEILPDYIETKSEFYEEETKDIGETSDYNLNSDGNLFF